MPSAARPPTRPWVAGTWRSTMSMAPSWSIPAAAVGVALDAAVGRVGRVARDARLAQRRRVRPCSVVVAVGEVRRAVRHHGIEQRTRGVPAGERRERPPAPEDPRDVGVRRRVRAHDRTYASAPSTSWRLHCNSSRPLDGGWTWASWKPGRIIPPARRRPPSPVRPGRRARHGSRPLRCDRPEPRPRRSMPERRPRSTLARRSGRRPRARPGDRRSPRSAEDTW